MNHTLYSQLASIAKRGKNFTTRSRRNIPHKSRINWFEVYTTTPTFSYEVYHSLLFVRAGYFDASTRYTNVLFAETIFNRSPRQAEMKDHQSCLRKGEYAIAQIVPKLL